MLSSSISAISRLRMIALAVRLNSRLARRENKAENFISSESIVAKVSIPDDTCMINMFSSVEKLVTTANMVCPAAYETSGTIVQNELRLGAW